ncbi:MAG TPA: hypothetical protein VGI03_12170 [Verrucomicrobiae bacterium]|jgi:hypothetical protein
MAKFFNCQACLIMGFWKDIENRTAYDDAEDLAYPPSGGRVKMLLLGIGLALLPVGYGIHCLLIHQTVLPGQDGDLDVHGSGAVALAISYIAVGVFIHAHWFWGLLPKLEFVSYPLKFVSVVVFLGSFGYGVYQAAM